MVIPVGDDSSTGVELPMALTLPIEQIEDQAYNLPLCRAFILLKGSTLQAVILFCSI